MTELRDRLQSALGSRYTIERELDGGGMSRVFVAADTTLQRRVVVKLLSPDLAAGVDVERFRREILLAASLTHPHIVPLLSSGEAEGSPYFTMPFIEGESLRIRLLRDGVLSLEDAVRLGREVAEALDYAHRRGIVHRDIKPANILLHDGHALVADFGIARAVRQAATGLTLTQAGLALGTPAYMSPEQALGESDIDGRTDVYSLGCVLYEMLTGTPPFEAATPQALIVRHCTAPVPPITGAPHDVAVAVVQALAKNPGERFATAAELARALEDAVGRASALAPASRSAPREKSVAVLPFENLTHDEASEYFSDGMTEDVIARLSRVGTLKVISRTSVMRYRKTTKSLREVAGELGVATVVEGTVRRAGTRLRIVAQLIDARTDEHLWAETFDRNLTDVFAIQSEIAEEIAKALAATLTPSERVQLARKPTDDLEAYRLYLLARYHYNRVTGADLEMCIDHLGDALRRDPQFAEAHALLSQACCYLGQGYWGHRPADYLSIGRRAATRALELNAGSSEAHAAFGMVKWWLDFDWAGAEYELQQAVALEPSAALPYLQYAVALGSRLRYAEAVRLMDRACSLDPVSVNLYHNSAFLLRFARQYDRARAQLEHSMRLEPNHPGGYWVLALLELDLGRFEQAITAAELNVRLTAGAALSQMTLATAYASAGRDADARRLVTELEVRERAGHCVWPMGLAMVFAQLGEVERGIVRLAQAVEERAGWVWMGMEPTLDPLRKDPRFHALAMRVGLAEL
jgi:eukaryotic-like serine/threonine-protein kinase